jgi:hypothetical protein
MSQFTDTIQIPSNEEYNLNSSEHVNTDLHSDIVHRNLVVYQGYYHILNDNTYCKQAFIVVLQYEVS